MIYTNGTIDDAANRLLSDATPGLGVQNMNAPVMTTPTAVIATPEAVMLTTAALNAMAAAMNFANAANR